MKMVMIKRGTTIFGESEHREVAVKSSALAELCVVKKDQPTEPRL